MNKYDKMIELNREKSDEKIAAAKLAIRKMLEEGDRITIPQLMKMTGLSRGFFYKNPIVRAEINQALEQQAGTIDPRRNILDKAMGGRIELLEQQVRELKQGGHLGLAPLAQGGHALLQPQVGLPPLPPGGGEGDGEAG